MQVIQLFHQLRNDQRKIDCLYFSLRKRDFTLDCVSHTFLIQLYSYEVSFLLLSYMKRNKQEYLPEAHH